MVGTICFFESGLDLLSFVDYYTNIDKGKSLSGVMCVSICGLKPRAIRTHAA